MTIGTTRGGMIQVRHSPQAVGMEVPSREIDALWGLGTRETQPSSCGYTRIPRAMEGLCWDRDAPWGLSAGGTVQVRHMFRATESPRPWKGCLVMRMPFGATVRVRHTSRTADAPESLWPWKGGVGIGTPNGGMVRVRHNPELRMQPSRLGPCWDRGTPWGYDIGETQSLSGGYAQVS